VSERFELLVLGLGNPLCGDDGAGIAAVARLLARWSAPEGTLVLDGGTLGLSLLPYLQQARHAILVDAVRTGDPPGTIFRLRGDDVARAAAGKLSPHQVGVADLLDSLQLVGGGPEELVLVGIAPARIDLELGCSPAVEARIDDLVEAVIQEAGRLGVHFLRDAERHGPAAHGDPDIPRILDWS
jgi:hydrogenase maturation protease